MSNAAATRYCFPFFLAKFQPANTPCFTVYLEFSLKSIVGPTKLMDMIPSLDTCMVEGASQFSRQVILPMMD